MNNRTILITGGTGKIGFVLVKHFLDKGMQVIATGMTKTSVERIKSQLSNSSSFVGLPIDLMDVKSSQNLSDFLKEEKLKLDVLVNNARNIKFLQINSDSLVERNDFLSELTLDVVVPYELSMCLSRNHKSLKRIINVSSQYGVVAANPSLYDNKNQSPIHYSIAKASVIHLTKELAVRLASSDIQVNCVAFGGIEGRVDQDFEKRYSKLLPLGRMLKEDEVIGAVEFLSSDASSGMTGHTLIVDGGWSIW
jgi:NAD(P)-dependent dehydrogenase (short-subunit alcohol dehydrogenase family)